MKVHYFQHVPFEGLGSIECELKHKCHKITSTKLYNEEINVSPKDIDRLIVMGGPMGIYDDEIYPWLKEEKKFIKEAILSGKTVLGICLGAQLIADALGAKVYKNKYREIGWFPVIKTKEAKDTVLSDVMPDKFEAFHWHGDTFDIPPKAVPIAESEACVNRDLFLTTEFWLFSFILKRLPNRPRLLYKTAQMNLTVPAMSSLKKLYLKILKSSAVLTE